MDKKILDSIQCWTTKGFLEDTELKDIQCTVVNNDKSTTVFSIALSLNKDSEWLKNRLNAAAKVQDILEKEKKLMDKGEDWKHNQRWLVEGLLKILKGED
jgi:hypothetical protein